MKRSCFTLIELVVVTSIVVLLMAVLSAALRNSRQQAKSAVCSSNIKQLTIALLMYETENQTFPYGFRNTLTLPPGGYPGNITYDRTGWWWFNYISDYSTIGKGKKTILWCPSRSIQDPKFDYVLHGNYGINRSICKSSDDRQNRREEFVRIPLCTDDIPYPSRTLLIVDSGYSLISWWHVTDVPPVALGNTIIEDTAYIPGLDINKKRDFWPGQEQDAIYGRHPNKTVNIGFADSHVEKRKAESLFVEKTADGYRNKNPLWQPK
jgi:prepilin-type processing-associated H-X9-DG protein